MNPNRWWWWTAISSTGYMVRDRRENTRSNVERRWACAYYSEFEWFNEGGGRHRITEFKSMTRGHPSEVFVSECVGQTSASINRLLTHFLESLHTNKRRNYSSTLLKACSCARCAQVTHLPLPHPPPLHSQMLRNILTKPRSFTHHIRFHQHPASSSSLTRGFRTSFILQRQNQYLRFSDPPPPSGDGGPGGHNSNNNNNNGYERLLRSHWRRLDSRVKFGVVTIGVGGVYYITQYVFSLSLPSPCLQTTTFIHTNGTTNLSVIDLVNIKFRTGPSDG